MVEDEDAQEHGCHLARDGDGYQRQGTVQGQGRKNKQLSDRARQTKEEDVEFGFGVGRYEVQGRRKGVERYAWSEVVDGQDVEFVASDTRREERGRERGREQQSDDRERGRKQVHEEHHLRSIQGTISGEDVVLRRVDDAIEDEVDAEQDHAEQGRRRRSFGGFALRFERHESPDPGRDQTDERVLVQREFASVEYYVHEHHRDQLARLAQEQGRE
ncbi:BQ5605_C004g02752 [Microbotryum silenes-dioicae]|uniref:BQ5605_C004g02752 protein n=1 Tax=Microbotryum silenes-dioicae TaxID=796604 RepID=A0A2X0MVT7_9BASI|nr:BQ5605_C004g02752 [Microbotryum silenes-dioicae]